MVQIDWFLVLCLVRFVLEVNGEVKKMNGTWSTQFEMGKESLGFRRFDFNGLEFLSATCKPP